MKHGFARYLACLFVIGVFVTNGFSDDTFYRLFGANNFAGAIKHADDNIPAPNRDGRLWAHMGIAHERTNAPEKALACYLVAIRMDANSYEAHLGAASVYNKLNQAANAEGMAKKAMELKMTGEASWEYARALITLGKGAEAKRALEEVVKGDQNNVVANRELGMIYYREKDFAKALPLLKRAISREPNSDIALQIAIAHRELNQNDSAIVYFNRAATDKSRPKPEALVELARLHYAAKNFKAAAENFEKANRNALNADDLFAWAVSLEETKADAKRVIDTYAAALARFGNSTSPSALTAREKVGRDHIAKKAWRPAETTLAPLLAADPEGKIVKDILFLMAQVHEGQNNIRQATELLERAIARDKNNVEAYARLGDLYARSGQADRAKATYDRLIAVDPNNPKIHLALGEYNLEAKKYADALRNFQRSFTLEGTVPAALGMMNSAWHLKRYDLARDAAESAMHRDPALKEPQVMLARIYMMEKNYRGARGVLLTLLRADQNNLALWKDLAECSQHLNDAQGLSDADKRIIVLDPKDIPSRTRVAQAAQAAGDLKTAYDLFKQLAVLQPQNVQVQRSLYEIALAQKDNNAAMTHMRALLVLQPNDAAGHRDLGNLQFAAKDERGALASYRAAVRADAKITGLYRNFASILIKNKTADAELMPVLVAAIAANEVDEPILVAAANIYQKQQNWPKAIETHQAVLRVNARNLASLSALAFCQEKAGRIDDAILSYEQATAMNPASVAEFKALGDLYAQQRKMPQAVVAYKKYLEKTPTDIATARLVGDYEFSQKKWEEANKFYALVTGTAANDTTFIRNFATSSFEAKNYQRAAQLYNRLATASPRDPLPLRQLYEIERINKNEAGAAAVLTRYVALVPGDAPMQRALGDLLFASGNNNGALAAYRAALRADPQIKGIYKNFVALVLRSGTPEEQISALTGAIAAKEADAAMFARLGDLHRAANNCRAALPVLQEASRMDPKSTAVLSSIADCHVRSNNHAEAAIILEQVTALNPQAVAEHKTLGDIYVNQKRMPQAVAAYKRFLDRGGKDNNAARLVGEDAFQKKNWADAVKYLAMVEGDAARAPAFLQMFGQAAFEVKDNPRAINIYRQLSAAAPQNADHVKTLYELAVRTGARDDAVTHLRNYVRLRPNDAAMQRALGDLLFDRKDRPGALAAYRAVLAADRNAKGFHKRFVELVMQGGTPAERIAALEGAIAAGEADTPMIIQLGNIYREQNQPARAVPLFDRAVKADPRNVELLLALAQSQQAAGQIDAAILTYEQYVAMNNRAIQELKILGDLYTQQKKAEQAMRMYRRYLERNPTDHAVALMVGRAAFDAKQWADAVRFLAMVQGPEAKRPELMKMLGTAAYEAKDNPRALTVLRELSTLTPRDAEVFKMLEDVCRRTNSADMATDFLRQYVALQPNDAAAQRRLADALFARNDTTGALTAYRAVLRIDPKAKGFFKNYVALVMTRHGQEAERVTAIQAAIEAKEADVGMFAALGGIFKGRNDCARAIPMFEQASKLDPRNGTFLGELADCQARAGRLREAAVTYEQAIALNPRAVDELKALGDIYMQDKKPDQAMAMYRRFLERQPDSSRIAQIVGDHAFGRKQWADAFRFLSMVKGNNTPEFHYRVGLSAIEIKNNKAAIESLERFRTAARAAPARTPVPNREDALRRLVAAYEAERNNAKAAEVLDELLKLPNFRDQDLAFKRGQLLEAAGDTAAAIRVFEANTSTYPRDHRNFLRAGTFYADARRGKNPARALTMFERAVAINDTISRAWFEMGMIYGSQRKDKEMMNAFQKFISIESRNPDPILRVGEYLLNVRKMPNEAMMFLEMANALRPNDPKIMAPLAQGYIQTGRSNDAMQLLERVVRGARGTPVDIEVRIALAEVYLEMGRFMDAVVEWKAVVDQRREPAFLVKYATALLGVGGNRNAEAMGIVNEVLARQRENVEALMLRGRIQTAMRNFEDAMETYKNVGYINPNHAPALYERANIFLIQQRFAEAKSFYERALRIDNKYALAEMGLARVAKAQRDEKEYNNRMERARRLDPNNREIQEETRRGFTGR